MILLQLKLTKLKLEVVKSVFLRKKQDMNTDSSTSAQVCFYNTALSVIFNLR